jgi:hypothetical protein
MYGRFDLLGHLQQLAVLNLPKFVTTHVEPTSFPRLNIVKNVVRVGVSSHSFLCSDTRAQNAMLDAFHHKPS